ncbi:MAG: hypothetical protein HW416_3878 [Chloroflexi bacterium]|nr:hypothetical protein [Chloroflexota bacterium]
MRLYAHCVTAALLLAVVVGFRHPTAEVLRVRGLIIEDSTGRARVLLGAPVPQIGERARRDGGIGMIVLSESGNDRLAVGYYPSPQMGGRVSQRIASAVGFAINDSAGNERTGYGYLDNGRVVLGLDYPNGREAVSLVVYPDGFAGMMVGSSQGKGYERVGLGVSNAENRAFIKIANEANSDAPR